MSQTIPRDKNARRGKKLRDAISAYGINLDQLRELVGTGERDLLPFLGSDVPDEARALLMALADLLAPTERTRITSPAHIAGMLMVEMSALDQEELRVVILNTKNQVLKIQTLYVGSLNASMVRVGEVFKEAIRLNAASIIVVHNHPSGEPTPSPEDVLVTRQIVEAGKLLDVDVLDHLVIGHGRWVSMREKGLGF